jgi:hypothetical protein
LSHQLILHSEISSLRSFNATYYLFLCDQSVYKNTRVSGDAMNQIGFGVPPLYLETIGRLLPQRKDERVGQSTYLVANCFKKIKKIEKQ